MATALDFRGEWVILALTARGVPSVPGGPSKSGGARAPPLTHTVFEVTQEEAVLGPLTVKCQLPASVTRHRPDPVCLALPWGLQLSGDSQAGRKVHTGPQGYERVDPCPPPHPPHPMLCLL